MSKKAEYQKYLQSAHWQTRRKEAIEAMDHACERCSMPRWLTQIAYQQDLNVHHLNYQNLGHEEFTDLEVLCRRCHDIETFGRSDFRPIKTAKCELCALDHWNVYENLCDKCSVFWDLSFRSTPDVFSFLSVMLKGISALQRGNEADDEPPF